jgi:hypothetical protein
VRRLGLSCKGFRAMRRMNSRARKAVKLCSGRSRCQAFCFCHPSPRHTPLLAPAEHRSLKSDASIHSVADSTAINCFLPP